MKKHRISLMLFALMLCTLIVSCFAAGAEQGAPAFSDVPADAWYGEAVTYCREKGWMGGVSATEFAPGGTMTRSMLVTALYRQAGSPAVTGDDSFTDTEKGAWYANAVCWAVQENVMKGYGNGLFGTEDPVTREQLVTILWRLAGSPGADAGGSFADRDLISDYALPAVAWARQNSIVNGKSGNRFDPKDNAARAEVATVLMNRDRAAASALVPSPGPVATPTPAPAPAENRVLVAYFSATNTTRPLAEYAADILHADLYEILPEQPYTEADLAYYTDCRADREQNDPNARPAIHGSVDNMAQYDIVFIGYPIWHGQPPRIISTFLESYDFSGKTIVPFCTSHSSGYSDSAIKPLAPDADWRTGRRFAGGTTRDDMAGWIDTLELPREKSKMCLRIGDTTWTATLEDNSSAVALKELLAHGPVTVEMHDYGGFEKVGGLGASLPRNDTQITTKPGDIILYQGNSITIYYDENTWSFTRLGHLDGVGDTELRRVLKAGGENVSVTLSLEPMDVGVFDFETKSVLLNSGYTMPINGLGTYSLHGESCINSVKSALRSGVRLIDTASVYGNEAEVGQAIREAIDEGVMKREDVFVITKIYPGSEMADPEAAIQGCLDRLNIGYVDMMLLHHPDPNDVKAYKAMEKFAADGKIRSLGLSNWYAEELTDFLPRVSVPPALVQNEIHPYYQENDVVPFIQSKGIVVQGWYPLGGRGHTSELLNNSTIKSIARTHGVSSAQVILRWDLQRGVVVIPGSSNPDHIKENTQLYHFALTEEEMTQIKALDRGEKHDWY